MKGLIADLTAEQDALDAIVAHIDGPSWCEQTPAIGWNVADQIGQLAFFDERATMAINAPGAFATELSGAALDIDTYMDAHLATARASTASELLSAWRTAREDLAEALGSLQRFDRVPWYGPDMSARSFATARLMEVWAHGQDVVDALGAQRRPSSRLRHIADLGVRTFGWSFSVRGLPVPDSPVFVELTGPGGEVWAWGGDSSTEWVRGDAEEFCLVVTQRRNIADTNLDVTGDTATEWMSIAQAFAGPPGPGRAATRSP